MSFGLKKFFTKVRTNGSYRSMKSHLSTWCFHGRSQVPCCLLIRKPFWPITCPMELSANSKQLLRRDLKRLSPLKSLIWLMNLWLEVAISCTLSRNICLEFRATKIGAYRSLDHILFFTSDLSPSRLKSIAEPNIPQFWGSARIV